MGNNQTSSLDPIPRRCNVFFFGPEGSGKTLFLQELIRTLSGTRKEKSLPRPQSSRGIEILRGPVFQTTDRAFYFQFYDVEGMAFGVNNHEQALLALHKYKTEQEGLPAGQEMFDAVIVHVCIYFFQPHRPCRLDPEVLRELFRLGIVVVPVIAKADTMTSEELDSAEKEIIEQLRSCGDQILVLPLGPERRIVHPVVSEDRKYLWSEEPIRPWDRATRYAQNVNLIKGLRDAVPLITKHVGELFRGLHAPLCPCAQCQHFGLNASLEAVVPFQSTSSSRPESEIHSDAHSSTSVDPSEAEIHPNGLSDIFMSPVDGDSAPRRATIRRRLPLYHRRAEYLFRMKICRFFEVASVIVMAAIWAFTAPYLLHSASIDPVNLTAVDDCQSRLFDCENVWQQGVDDLLQCENKGQKQEENLLQCENRIQKQEDNLLQCETQEVELTRSFSNCSRLLSECSISLETAKRTRSDTISIHQCVINAEQVREQYQGLFVALSTVLVVFVGITLWTCYDNRRNQTLSQSWWSRS